MASAKAPGRLGDPEMSPGTEPRIHPLLLESMKLYGLDAAQIPEAPAYDAPFDEIYAFTTGVDKAIGGGLYAAVDYNIPALQSSISVTKSEEYATAPDGHKVKLIIQRPSEAKDTLLPAILYIHGGGMVVNETINKVHDSWTESLARTGLVAITIDFRNAFTKTDHNPFPTGLNDCAAAVQWIAARKEQLDIGKLVIQGESGGANLCIATALKAKQEGWLDVIDGVCAFIPYISGAYHHSREWKLENLPSLVECNGYFISCELMAALTRVYDPSGDNAKNPLAWPYWATQADLQGLPPFLVYVNELDPLRDEGSVFYRNLVKAGVKVVAKMNLGAFHGGEIILRHAMPDQFLANVREIKSFIESL